MKRTLFTLASLSLLAGCFDTGTGDSGTSTDTTTDTQTPAELAATVEWGASSITVTLTGMDDGGYYFGMAESSASTDPWTGEDCMDGYTTGSGTNYTYCHPVPASGVMTLNYGGGFDDLAEGSETVFGSQAFDGDVTYYLEETSTGDCWVFGRASSHYDNLGCTGVFK